jgi:hypothetical protein
LFPAFTGRSGGTGLNEQFATRPTCGAQATGKEPPQIRGIRADSTYLTPTLGLLSADTWTLVALYIGNLLLNWLLFVPFFMGVLFFPRLCR